ncbi:hypothetical protein BH09BAC1_BH09BAC1_02630 [soil metagenome]
MTALLWGGNAMAQKAVGDTLRFSVLAGGGITVPESEEWRFVSLTYSQGANSMRTTYDGPDTLKSNDTWYSPFWNVEAQLLGDGKSEGFYNLKVVRIK